jgi:WD repeat and SOF domain-containing protein 1
MKVKVLNRNEEDFTRERAQDLKKVHRNYEPTLHQFQRAHEYTRALNAAKLQKVFAKPFIAALTHSDGITCLARNPRILNSLLAGSADGDIRIWDIPVQRTLRRLKGHTGAVKGISFAPDGETCVSCSTDCSVSENRRQAGSRMRQYEQAAAARAHKQASWPSLPSSAFRAGLCCLCML